MISVVVTAGGEKSGRWTVEVDGHASPEVCAYVTAVQQTVAVMLSELAAHLPEHISFRQEGPPS